ncbi:MAG: hypothetical protein AAFP19_22465, partial [Bacteroidota bacterium]
FDLRELTWNSERPDHKTTKHYEYDKGRLRRIFRERAGKIDREEQFFYEKDTLRKEIHRLGDQTYNYSYQYFPDSIQVEFRFNSPRRAKENLEYKTYIFDTQGRLSQYKRYFTDDRGRAYLNQEWKYTYEEEAGWTKKIIQEFRRGLLYEVQTETYEDGLLIETIKDNAQTKNKRIDTYDRY